MHRKKKRHRSKDSFSATVKHLKHQSTESGSNRSKEGKDSESDKSKSKPREEIKTLKEEKTTPCFMAQTDVDQTFGLVTFGLGTGDDNMKIKPDNSGTQFLFKEKGVYSINLNGSVSLPNAQDLIVRFNNAAFDDEVKKLATTKLSFLSGSNPFSVTVLLPFKINEHLSVTVVGNGLLDNGMRLIMYKVSS